jgi:hypothetical protein
MKYLHVISLLIAISGGISDASAAFKKLDTFNKLSEYLSPQKTLKKFNTKLDTSIIVKDHTLANNEELSSHKVKDENEDLSIIDVSNFVLNFLSVF